VLESIKREKLRGRVISLGALHETHSNAGVDRRGCYYHQQYRRGSSVGYIYLSRQIYLVVTAFQGFLVCPVHGLILAFLDEHLL